jgi:hypothetical protein
MLCALVSWYIHFDGLCLTHLLSVEVHCAHPDQGTYILLFEWSQNRLVLHSRTQSSNKHTALIGRLKGCYIIQLSYGTMQGYWAVYVKGNAPWLSYTKYRVQILITTMAANTDIHICVFVCISVVDYLTMLSVAQIIQSRMIGWLISTDSLRLWKEVVVA